MQIKQNQKDSLPQNKRLAHHRYTLASKFNYKTEQCGTCVKILSRNV